MTCIPAEDLLTMTDYEIRRVLGAPLDRSWKADDVQALDDAAEARCEQDPADVLRIEAKVREARAHGELYAETAWDAFGTHTDLVPTSADWAVFHGMCGNGCPEADFAFRRSYGETMKGLIEAES